MIKSVEYIDINGYCVESHQVTTEDGYILSLIRVPNNNNNNDENVNNYNNQESRNPVLVVHGFQCSSADWFTDVEDNILPYQLVNEGYDCWVANLRGTPLSQNHVDLDPKSNEFWDFSVHEIANFDIPAIIDYILAYTEKSFLSYIGHSMGVAVFAAGMSLRPEYCSKINLCVALAPAVYIDNISSKTIRNFVAPLVSNYLSKIPLVTQLLSFSVPLTQYTKALCGSVKNSLSVGGWIVRNYGLLFGASGSESGQIDQERMEKISEHWPSSFGFKTLCHGMQAIHKQKFAQYDYGTSENMQRYGQASPPAYDLQKVSVPIATFHAKDDHLCTPQDVTRLSQDLPNVVGNFGISEPEFTHVDFMFGKDANKLVYQPVIQMLRKHSRFPVVRSLRRASG